MRYNFVAFLSKLFFQKSRFIILFQKLLDSLYNCRADYNGSSWLLSHALGSLGKTVLPGYSLRRGGRDSESGGGG